MNTKFFALAAFALSLAACTNDNEAIDNSPVAARINAEISDAVTTRASGTQWATYDQIGVSTIAGTGTYYNNVCYEWNGSSFTTPSENAIYFQTPESVTFRAYYPSAREVRTRRLKTGPSSTSSMPPEPLPIRTILR